MNWDWEDPETASRCHSGWGTNVWGAPQVTGPNYTMVGGVACLWACFQGDQLTENVTKVKWVSLDRSVARVWPAVGLQTNVTGVATGTAVIRADIKGQIVDTEFKVSPWFASDTSCASFGFGGSSDPPPPRD